MSLNSHNPALSTVDQHKLLQEEADYSPSFQHGLLPFPHRRIFSKLILDSTMHDLHLSREEFLFQFEDSVILLSYLPVWNANQSSSLLQLSSCLRAQLNFYRTLSTCFRQTCKIRSWFIFLYVFCLGTFWIKQIPLWVFFVDERNQIWNNEGKRDIFMMSPIVLMVSKSPNNLSFIKRVPIKHRWEGRQRSSVAHMSFQE